MKRDRPSWPQYALIMAEAALTRSEDPWVQVGACVLRHNNSVASVGYNGAAEGKEIDWSNRDQRRKFAIHAEVNCLRYVRPGECYLLACSMSPCENCVKEISAYGIKQVFFYDLYERAGDAFEVAKVLGVELTQIARPH